MPRMHRSVAMMLLSAFLVSCSADHQRALPAGRGRVEGLIDKQMRDTLRSRPTTVALTSTDGTIISVALSSTSEVAFSVDLMPGVWNLVSPDKFFCVTNIHVTPGTESRFSLPGGFTCQDMQG